MKLGKALTYAWGTVSLVAASIVILNLFFFHVAWLEYLKWLATIAGVVGAMVLALNISISGYGFISFLVSSVSWVIVGFLMAEPSLIVQNSVYTAINVLGIYRWLSK